MDYSFQTLKITNEINGLYKVAKVLLQFIWTPW